MGGKYRNRSRKRNSSFNSRDTNQRGNPVIPHVEITQDAYDSLCTYRQIEGVEHPGVLVGSVVGDNHYRINKVSPPLPRGKSSRTGCERDGDMANAYVLTEYEQSGHTRIYLGEWHTHPEALPTPSPQDFSEIKKISYLPDKLLPFVILCIVGQREMYWGHLVNGELRKFDVEMV